MLHTFSALRESCFTPTFNCICILSQGADSKICKQCAAYPEILREEAVVFAAYLVVRKPLTFTWIYLIGRFVPSLILHVRFDSSSTQLPELALCPFLFDSKGYKGQGAHHRVSTGFGHILVHILALMCTTACSFMLFFGLLLQVGLLEYFDETQQEVDESAEGEDTEVVTKN